MNMLTGQAQIKPNVMPRRPSQEAYHHHRWSDIGVGTGHDEGALPPVFPLGAHRGGEAHAHDADVDGAPGDSRGEGPAEQPGDEPVGVPLPPCLNLLYVPLLTFVA